MKWYFASRTRHTQKLVVISKFLERKGETILSDWIYIGMLTPFEEHKQKVQEVAVHDIKAILGSDIFVLVSDPEGTDMFVELGVALAKHTAQLQHIQIYIVGEHSKRSLMQLHPAVRHASTLQEVFDDTGIEYSGFEFPDLT